MNIKKGDLVMVVRPAPCCGSSGGLGRAFIVDVLDRTDTHTNCCGETDREMCAWGVGDDDEGFYLKQLIKIDPPAEGETREAYKELTA